MGRPRRSAHHRRPGDRHRARGHPARRRASRHHRTTGCTGLGCATFTQRLQAVVAAVDQACRPAGDRPASGRHRGPHPDGALLVVLARRSGAEQRAVRVSTWRCGTSPASGPACRSTSCSAAGCARRPTYLHAGGATVRRHDRAGGRPSSRDGWPHVRLQIGQPGLGTYGAPGSRDAYPDAPYPDGWDVEHYLRTTPELFARARARTGRRRRAAARRPQPTDARSRRACSPGRSSRTGCSSSRT